MKKLLQQQQNSSISHVLELLNFQKPLFLQNSLRFTTKWRGSYRNFPRDPCLPATCKASLSKHHSSEQHILPRGTYTDMSFSPKVRSLPQGSHWCCTVFEFGQIFNDMYPSLLYWTEYFQCSNSPPYSAYSSPLAAMDFFYCRHSFATSRLSYS